MKHGNPREEWEKYSSILIKQAPSENVLHQFATKETEPIDNNSARFSCLRLRTPSPDPQANDVIQESNRRVHDTVYETVAVPVRRRTDEIQVVPGTDVEGSAAQQGRNIGGTLDERAFEALCTGTNVRYAGGKTVRNMVDETSRITLDELRAMAEEMRSREGRRFKQTHDDRGSYIVLCHTDLEPDIHDLQAATHNAFVPVSEYGRLNRKAYEGELGSFEDEQIRFVTSSTFAPFCGAGAVTDSTAHQTSPGRSQKRFNVYPVLMLARDSFGFAGPWGSEGDDSRIVQPARAAPADGLVQDGSIRVEFGWACEILN